MNTPTPPFTRNPFSNNVSVDPDQRLPDTIRSQFHALHLEYDDMFNTAISKYNGATAQPSLMPNVDKVLRDIGQWNYLIISDHLKSFYQIPLAHSSMKYCAVATPFNGICVYTRCAMGMPGSETCFEELISKVLGGLI